MTYSLFDYLMMFGSTFFMVFLLGLQSKNVMQSKYLAAIITSLGISIGNFLFIRYAATGSYLALLGCALGGCAGISFSIWFSDNILHKKRDRNSAENAPEGSPLRSGTDGELRVGIFDEVFTKLDSVRESATRLRELAERLSQTGVRK